MFCAGNSFTSLCSKLCLFSLVLAGSSISWACLGVVVTQTKTINHCKTDVYAVRPEETLAPYLPGILHHYDPSYLVMLFFLNQKEREAVAILAQRFCDQITIAFAGSCLGTSILHLSSSLHGLCCLGRDWGARVWNFLWVTSQLHITNTWSIATLLPLPPANAPDCKSRNHCTMHWICGSNGARW